MNQENFEFSERQKDILRVLKAQPLTVSELQAALRETYSLATLRRDLKRLIEEHRVAVQGFARATRYSLSKAQTILEPIDLESYFSRDQDERFSDISFDFSLFERLKEIPLFTRYELRLLDDREGEFEVRLRALSNYAREKEMERLGIDLSWKSSQIEGNTYSLLETEELLKHSRAARGHTKEEATMLLNHKKALQAILKEASFFSHLTVRKIESVQAILVENLNVPTGLRTFPVGITGTNYKPLDITFQIKEALESLCEVINVKKHPLEKALLALVGIAYIQPFADGNKRTSRLLANAALISKNYCPVSFRTVDPVDYKKAMLVFYETGNIQPIKKIFTEQFAFSAANYF